MCQSLFACLSELLYDECVIPLGFGSSEKGALHCLSYTRKPTYMYGVETLMVSASQRLLWRVRPEKNSKCIDVADGSIGSIESIESIDLLDILFVLYIQEAYIL